MQPTVPLALPADRSGPAPSPVPRPRDRRQALALALACALLPPAAAGPSRPQGPLPSARPVPTQDPIEALRDAVVERRLENGWTLLLLPRPGPPIIAFETAIDVGAADEPLGLSGLAHMLEHMAFKGSDRLGTTDWPAERAALERVDERYAGLVATTDRAARGRALAAFREAQEQAGRYVVAEAFSAVLENAGGTRLNASTSADITRYTVTLPGNRLELWAWMEAERFDRLVLREFYLERDAVLEERNLTVDSDPIGTLVEQLALNAFQAHPYGRPVIGFESDIRSYTRANAQEFFERHYGARRLTTAIVGAVDPETALPLLERHLSRLAPGPQPRRHLTREPEQRGERRATVHFPAQPLLAIGWHVPERSHPEGPAIEVAVRLLGDGRSSRLERRLVHEQALAAEVFVGSHYPGERHPSLAYVLAVPNAGVDLARIEEAIYGEIALLAAAGPRAEELAAVRNKARAAFLREVRDREALAEGLTTAAIQEGDWRAYFEGPQRLAAVDATAVRRVLGRWFVARNRTVVSLMPTEEGAGSQAVPEAPRPSEDPPGAADRGADR